MNASYIGNTEALARVSTLGVLTHLEYLQFWKQLL